MGFITHCSNSGCVSTWIDPRHLRIPWCSFFFLSFFLTLFLLYYACSNPAFVCVNACYPIQTGFRTSYEFWGEIQQKCSIAGSTTTTTKKKRKESRSHRSASMDKKLSTAQWRVSRLCVAYCTLREGPFQICSSRTRIHSTTRCYSPWTRGGKESIFEFKIKLDCFNL